MSKRPKILLATAVPVILAGIAVMVYPGAVAPWLALLLPTGLFLLGLSVIDRLSLGEFALFDAEQLAKGGSPGDEKQHIIRNDPFPQEVYDHAHELNHAPQR